MDEKIYEYELCTRISLSDSHYAGNLIDELYLCNINCEALNASARY